MKRLMKVLPDGTKKWQIINYTGGRNSQRISGILFGTAEEADEADRIAKTRLGKVETEREKTLQQFSVHYLEHCAAQKGIKDKTKVVKILCREWGQHNLSTINLYMLEIYQGKMLKAGLKPATINRRIACLKHMVTKAVDWHMAGDDGEVVLKEVRRCKMLKENNARDRYLTVEEIDRLLVACEKSRMHHVLYPLVVSALNTGARLSELMRLTWDDIDWRNLQLTIRDSKNGDPRKIPMNETLQDALRAMVRRADKKKIFLRRNGEDVRSMRKAWVNVLMAAGIRDFHFHDLRHTFASHLVMNGAHLLVVKKLLGHKTLKMTERYSHFAPDMGVEAVKSLDKSVTHVTHNKAQGNQ